MTKKDLTVAKQAVSTFILLDRSGSMSNDWDEVIPAINSYAHKLKEDTVKDDSITLAVFDCGGFDIVRDNLPPAVWNDVSPDEFRPRGMTPLLDSLGKIITKAEEHNADKTVIVVMTDGAENSSKEYTKEDIRKAMKRIEDKGWEVVFMGASFEGIGDQSAFVGGKYSNTVNVGKGMRNVAYTDLAMKSRAYASSGVSGQCMSFSDEERVKYDSDGK